MKTFTKKQLPVGRNLKFRGCIGRSFLASVTSALLLSATAAQAATLTVTSANDSGAGTLRQAILSASPGDTINFAAGITTITLLSGELLINKNLTINGPGANLLTVKTPAHSFRIFDIASTTITCRISGLTIANGGAYETNRYGGAGIHNAGALTITNCTISGNYSGNGGHGGGDGGGIENLGVLTISNSTISGNSADWYGGGLFNYGIVTITSSSICSYERGGLLVRLERINLSDSDTSLEIHINKSEVQELRDYLQETK